MAKSQTPEQRLDQEGAMRIMKSRALISEPGKYQVQVTNDVKALALKGSVRKALAGGKVQVSIINLKAATPYHLEKFKAYFNEGNFDDAVNNNLTVSVRDCDYMPEQGDVVNITVGYITTKNGEEALAVTSYTEVPVGTPGKMTMESLTSFCEQKDVTKRAELVTGADVFDVKQ